MNNGMSIVALIVALAAAGAVILLFKKRIIDESAIEGIGQVIEGIPAVAGTPFAMIREYARIAVRTVEQLVKNGTIPRDDEARKEAALDMIETAAKLDGIKFGDAEEEAADMCIEAEVFDLPSTEKPDETSAK